MQKFLKKKKTTTTTECIPTRCDRRCAQVIENPGTNLI